MFHALSPAQLVLDGMAGGIVLGIGLASRLLDSGTGVQR
jgi:hypothetical protein